MLSRLKTLTASQPNRLAFAASPWLVLSVLLIGTVFGTLSNSMVSIAVPALMDAFDQPLSLAVYAVTLFTLSLAVFMPVFGSLGSRFGFKQIYLFCISLFALSSLVAGLSQNFFLLLVCRVLQGIGAAGVLPTVMAKIAVLFDAEQRGKAVGVWALANGIGHAAGPPLSGYLVQNSGWRSIFLMLVPFALLCAALVWKLLPGDRQSSQESFDISGATALTTAAYAFLLALNQTARMASGLPFPWWLWLVAVGAAVYFLLRERSIPKPFVDLKLFRNQRYTAAIVLVSTDSLTLFGLMIATPVFLIRLAGVETQHAGLMMLCLTLCMALLGPLAGHLADRRGIRLMCVTGLLLVFAGELVFLLLTNRFSASIPAGLVILCLVAIGSGLGLIQSPSTTAVIQVVAPQQIGIASGIFHMLRFMMGSFGSMIFGLILELDPNGLLGGFKHALLGMMIAALLAGLASIRLPGIRTATRPSLDQVGEI